MEDKVQKKSRKLLIVFIILLILILIGVISAWYIISNMDQNRPDEVIYSYISCLMINDYEGMYSMLSESTKSRVEHDTYIVRNKNIYEGIEGSNIEIKNLTYNEENKTVNYDLTFDTLAGSLTYNYTATFDRQDDNKYYLNWYSNLIFPDLEEEYKVRVYSNSGSRGDILDRNGKVLATNNENGERVYPYGKIAAHLVGYIRGISAEELENHKGAGYTESSVIGKTGLELAYEERLRGKNGSGIYIVNENEEIVTTIAETDIADGEDIKTTIDIDLQQQIYEEFEGDKGFSIAMNPKTGEVLAMVSFPTFDTNKFITGFTDEEWSSLSSDEDTPMFARYESTWAPGSSFKPITAAIGLTTNSFTADENFGTSGLSWQKDSSWGDYKVTTLTTYSGPANLRNALIYSDNIYFAKAAIKIGGKNFAEQLLKIGFDKDLDFPISMYNSQFANNNEFDSEVQLADSGYGQGKVLVNPLHVASIYSAFVNDGSMIKPHIEYSQKTEYLYENVFSEDTVNEIVEDLIQVVENPNGTGYAARINGISIAGKTGTAELKSSKEEDGEELGWFNAFLVNDNSEEQFLTINMVENVENRGGSHYLLPKVKNIIQEYIK